jgi:cell division protease FtsH
MMSGYLSNLGSLFVGPALGMVAATSGIIARKEWRLGPWRWKRRSETPIAKLIRKHFDPIAIDDIAIAERRFPYRVRSDLQRAIDRLCGSKAVIRHFSGVRQEFAHHELTLAACIVPGQAGSAVAVPPQYEEIDIGDEQPVRCLKNGIWFLEEGANRFVVLLGSLDRYDHETGIQFQIGAPNNAEGARITQEFFRQLEESVLKAESYRGKILSLESTDYSYSGESAGIRVHKLRPVDRDQVILPRKTLDLLDRNVIDFVRQRPQLAKFRQATKKGLLFYGPPGTGKTHTIHYLANALAGHTTLLVTAEQIGLLGQYMTLARLLQPSIVVIEDADLVARDRTEMGPCEEMLLNKLLNEMDGLKEEADILFVLTTNRPEALERALAARPGRIDQAIEFPLPDADGRAKLVRLYAQGVEICGDVVVEVVKRTDRVSAAFIKELMRRAVQFQLGREGSGCIELADVEGALEEMLFRGGSLNLKLLGAEGAHGARTALGFHCRMTRA